MSRKQEVISLRQAYDRALALYRFDLNGKYKKVTLPRGVCDFVEDDRFPGNSIIDIVPCCADADGRPTCAEAVLTLLIREGVIKSCIGYWTDDVVWIGEAEGTFAKVDKEGGGG